MHTKFIFIFTLIFGASWNAFGQATTNPVYYVAGTLAPNTMVEVAYKNSMAYSSNVAVYAQNQMMTMQKSLMQGQIQDQIVYIAKDAFSSLMGPTKDGKRQLHTRKDKEVPYYKVKGVSSDDLKEQMPVETTPKEAVDQIADVQKSLDKASGTEKDCDPKLAKAQPGYSSWDQYIKNIENLAATAKPPINKAAVKHTVDFLKSNQSRLEKKLLNRDYVVINDFTVGSNNKRMIVLDLKNKKIERYYVAHGLPNSEPQRAMAPGFSSEKDKNLTPPGFHVMENEVYSPNFKKKILMDGLESRNANSKDRDIVFHGSRVSEKEVKDVGYLGTSWGCNAVPWKDYDKLRSKLQGGVLSYNFTPEDNN